ncbi:MAG: prepilin-type N-terminal cleavage/methylation domain-containing protein [Candidatus Aenigmarchaeota archaeon]|nr:prepilin-type N-terminal cleavage/methylation domain-containing protein [Candidatus Aenigmarchaeota archaeon]
MSTTRIAGFTLLELIIVVILLGIVSAVMIPALATQESSQPQAIMIPAPAPLFLGMERQFEDHPGFSAPFAPLGAKVHDPSRAGEVVYAGPGEFRWDRNTRPDAVLTYYDQNGDLRTQVRNPDGMLIYEIAWQPAVTEER